MPQMVLDGIGDWIRELDRHYCFPRGGKALRERRCCNRAILPANGDLCLGFAPGGYGQKAGRNAEGLDLIEGRERCHFIFPKAKGEKGTDRDFFVAGQGPSTADGAEAPRLHRTFRAAGRKSALPHSMPFAFAFLSHLTEVRDRTLDRTDLGHAPAIYSSEYGTSP